LQKQVKTYQFSYVFKKKKTEDNRMKNVNSNRMTNAEKRMNFLDLQV